jgi:hypothetical protein
MNARSTSGLLPAAAAALAGGVLAALVLEARRSVNWLILGALILAVVVFWILAVGTLLSEDRRSTTPALPSGPRAAPAGPAVGARPAAGAPSRNGWATATSVPHWSPPATPSPSRPASGPGGDRAGVPAEDGRQPANVAVPVPSSAWWRAATADTPETERAPARTELPSLDRLDPAAAARIVQCPRCGDFAVDLTHEHPGFAFRCHRCQHTWRWTPGTAWPVSVVRPRLGRR